MRIDTSHRTGAIPIVQLALILPAAVFMAALVVRGLGAPAGEPAHSAQAVVMWYAARLWTLWVLLTALPLAALGLGCLALAAGARTLRGMLPAGGAAPFVVGLTAAAGVILVIVALHVMMN